MKKILMILLAMMLLLASCSMAGNNPDNTDDPEIDQPTEPVEPETPAEPEEPVQAPLSRPNISFIDFIDPGTRSAAIVMTTSEQNAEIWYTTDGTTPYEDNGIEYGWNKRTVICGSTVVTAVPVSSGSIVKAVTSKDGRYSSEVRLQVVPS